MPDTAPWPDRSGQSPLAPTPGGEFTHLQEQAQVKRSPSHKNGNFWQAHATTWLEFLPGCFLLQKGGYSPQLY